MLTEVIIKAVAVMSCIPLIVIFVFACIGNHKYIYKREGVLCKILSVVVLFIAVIVFLFVRLKLKHFIIGG